MIELMSNEIINEITVGRIKIETRIGVLEYSYQTGDYYDAGYQLENTLPDYNQLTDEELDEIDNIITNTMNK